MGSLEVGINRSVARLHPQQRLLIGCCVVAQNRTVNCAAKPWSRWPVRFASWKRRRARPFDLHNTAVKLSGFNRCRTQHPVKRRHLLIALRVQCLPSSNQQFEKANAERRNRIRGALLRRNTDLQSVRPAEFHSAESSAAGRMSAGRTGHSPMFHLGVTRSTLKAGVFSVGRFLF
jgi:hypothetical protein